MMSSSADQFVNISVKNHQDRDVVKFRVKKTVPLRRVFKAFCERKRLVYNTIQFIYSGVPVNEKNTPGELRMEDGDEIDAMRHQIGGGGVRVTKG